MSKWYALIVAALMLFPDARPALAAGYYNLGAYVQPESPLGMTEYGYMPAHCKLPTARPGPTLPGLTISLVG